MFDLALSPVGHLHACDTVDASGVDLPAALADPLRAAFAESTPAGLLALASAALDGPLPPSPAYWRGFAERYLLALCHAPEASSNLSEPVPPPVEEFADIATSAPPMRGGEYLRTETLADIWGELDSHARAAAAAHKGGFDAWLKERNPLWNRVGRVCFHLAENKRDAERPFAFLATYAPKLLDGRRVQYQPLGKALEEYAGARNKKTLVNMLTPVERAAARRGWVREIVDSGEIFHPLRWTPKEAHQFLKDIPSLEGSGLLVRVPDWWARTPARVKVSVSVGGKKPSRFGADAMLDFSVGLSVEGEAVSEEELASLLAGGDGLVRVKGRWVEVDRDKLTEALAQWRRIEKEAGDGGVSFIEGMRLLAGAPLGREASAGLFAGERADWAEVHAGEWLEERLRQLRDPSAIRNALPGGELKAVLRHYQEAGVAWLWFLTKMGLGACLADDMGLGKTIQVIALLLTLKRERRPDEGAPALLALPASLLANWKSEFERFAPSLRVRFAHPSQTSADELRRAERDPAAFAAGVDAMLTTYAMVDRLKWLGKIEWGIVILDEAQAIKNPGTRQAKAVKALKAGTRIALTGTPVENRLGDLWSIFDFLSPGLLGSPKEFGDFVRRLDQREGGTYAPLRRLLSPYILRRLKTDKSVIADLPDKTEVKAFCGLSARQAALYEKSVRELKDALEEREDGGIARRGLILAFILRFKQICNHPGQWLGDGGYEAADSGKFRRVAEICEEIAARQEKVLVFTQFREIIDPLADHLRGVFGRPGLILHGETPVGRRRALVDEFQSEDGPPFFVLSLKAGGTGLNLTAASHVIHFDRWWNPAVENQATDRAFRIGQRRNVMVHKFVCRGTIEERVDEMIAEKTGLAAELLEEGSAPKLLTEMGDEELLNFVRLDVNSITEE